MLWFAVLGECSYTDRCWAISTKSIHHSHKILRIYVIFSQNYSPRQTSDRTENFLWWLVLWEGGGCLKSLLACFFFYTFFFILIIPRIAKSAFSLACCLDYYTTIFIRATLAGKCNNITRCFKALWRKGGRPKIIRMERGQTHLISRRGIAASTFHTNTIHTFQTT